MNRKSRWHLIFGTAVLIILMSTLFVYFNYTQALVGAQSAYLSSGSYTVGTDYTGLVTKQFVTPGQQVHTGDNLFHVKSNTLEQDLRNKKVTKDDLLYPLTSDGQIVIKATKPGIVQKIDYTQGSFVPANKEIATIVDVASIQVKASFKLNPRQYQSISDDTRIIVGLPNKTRLESKVDNIAISQQDGILLANIDGKLGTSGLSSLTSVQGTPVNATLQLSKATLWNKILNAVKN